MFCFFLLTDWLFVNYLLIDTYFINIYFFSRLFWCLVLWEFFVVGCCSLGFCLFCGVGVLGFVFFVQGVFELQWAWLGKKKNQTKKQSQHNFIAGNLWSFIEDPNKINFLYEVGSPVVSYRRICQQDFNQGPIWRETFVLNLRRAHTYVSVFYKKTSA